MHSFDGCSLVNELVSNQEQRNERKFEDYEKKMVKIFYSIRIAMEQTKVRKPDTFKLSFAHLIS